MPRTHLRRSKFGLLTCVLGHNISDKSAYPSGTGRDDRLVTAAVISHCCFLRLLDIRSPRCGRLAAVCSSMTLS
ncbi:hypothetical protein BV25DRAFT_356037 [Artomyces pyxidatus]|uniref:Uncharacterized protein n=1 Tax=Artomyces pyxidatus TaxID=48021 RepID=A0ACB8T651_9AGAM|nr:hypothetical protein BV25DRAFT_356037 [Artomyces pyxidatus]